MWSNTFRLGTILGVIFSLGTVLCAHGQETPEETALTSWLFLDNTSAPQITGDHILSGATPKAGDFYKSPLQDTLYWQQHTSPTPVIDFDRVLNERKQAFAYTTLDVSETGNYPFRIWRKGPIKIWINGKLVHDQDTQPIHWHAKEIFYADLNQGKNSILVHLRKSERFWTFSLSHPDQTSPVIYGRVSLPNRMAGSQAEVLLSCDRKIIAKTTTNSSGLYALDAPSGTQHCYLKAALDEYGTWTNIATSFLQPGFNELNLTLAPAPKIQGTVFTMDMEPQVGAFIEAVRIQDNLLAATAFTDGSGNFALRNLPDGDYSLEISTPWGYEHRQTTLEGIPFSIKNSQSIFGAKLALPKIRKGNWFTLNTLDGLPYHLVHDLLINSDGYLICATYGAGTCQFNGNSFSSYNLKEELPSNHVYRLLETSDGDLWIGTSEGLARVKKDSLALVTFSDGSTKQDIKALFEDSQERVWVGTDHGLYQIKNGIGTPIPEFMRHAHEGAVRSIGEDKQGRVWVGTPGGAGYFEGNTFIPIKSTMNLGVEDIYAANDGTMWLSTGTGALHLSGDKSTFYTSANGLPHDEVKSVCESEDGLLWMASRKGLVLFNGHQFTTYTPPDGSSQDNLTTVDCSIPGLIWAASHNGIVRFNYSLQNFGTPDGLHKPGIFDISGTLKDQMYISTDWASVYQFNGTQFSPIDDVEPDLYVRKIVETSPSELVLGTNKGLVHVSPGNAEHPPKTFAPAEWVLALEQDAAGSIWAGYGWTGQGLSVFDLHTGEQIKQYTLADGLPNENVWSLLYSDTNGLWVGTNIGIALFESNEFRNIHQEFDLKPAIIYDIYEDDQGDTWFAGSDGVYRYSKASWTHFTEDGIYELLEDTWQLLSDDLKLPENNVWSLHQSADGIMWFGMQSWGVVMYDGHAYSHLTTRDGLAGNHVMSIISDSAGTVWLGTLQGGLSQLKRNAASPSLLIRSIQHDDQIFSAQESLPSFSLVHPVTLHLEEVDLTSNSLNRQFLITVMNRQGDVLDQILTKERSYNWTPQKAGDYQLHIQYIDQYLNAYPESRIALRMRLPLAQNPYVVLPFFLFILGITGYSIKTAVKNRQQKKAAQELERKMLKNEIEAKEQLVLINEELLETNQKLEGRTDSLREAVEKNKEILGIAAHDLKNPLGGIIGLAEMILEDIEKGIQAAYESAVENVPMLKEEAERMLLIIKQLLDTQREVHQITLNKERLVLGDVVATVLRWNDRQATNKNISLHYDTCSTIIVDVDEVAVQRVLDNYVSNAIKYSPNGTSVWIEITGSYTTIQGFPTVKVSVRDEGPGLTEEDKEKVFGKMQRLSAKPTGGEHSTGLGLFIVKSLIEAHGGEVGVDSEAGNGASFWFTLPSLHIALDNGELPLDKALHDSAFFAHH